MDLARTIKKEQAEAGNELREKDGWRGPIGLGGGNDRTLLHNVRFWWRPKGGDRPTRFRYDSSLNRWQGIGPSIIVVAIRYKDPIDGLNHSDLLDEVIIATASYREHHTLLIVDDARTSRWQEASIPMQPLYGVGDISFYSPFSHLCDKLLFPGLKVLRVSHVKRVKIFAPQFCLNMQNV